MATEDLKAPQQKPSVSQLGIDLATLNWQRSGAESGSFEVAFVGSEPGKVREAGKAGGEGEAAAKAARWILLRVADDPAGRVLVYDRIEWECFLDGVRGGEFDQGRGAGAHAGPEQPGGVSRRRSGRAVRQGGDDRGCSKQSVQARRYFSN